MSIWIGYNDYLQDNFVSKHHNDLSRLVSVKYAPILCLSSIKVLIFHMLIVASKDFDRGGGGGGEGRLPYETDGDARRLA